MQPFRLPRSSTSSPLCCACALSAAAGSKSVTAQPVYNRLRFTAMLVFVQGHGACCVICQQWGTDVRYFSRDGKTGVVVTMRNTLFDENDGMMGGEFLRVRIRVKLERSFKKSSTLSLLLRWIPWPFWTTQGGGSLLKRRKIPYKNSWAPHKNSQQNGAPHANHQFFPSPSQL